ncbi:MAG: hypothetical protein ABI626_03625 [Sphingomicrobium sp.]
MSSAPSAPISVSDARWLAQAFEPSSGLVRLVAMTERDYRAASFLDDRMLQASVVSETRPLAEVVAALPADMRQDARWIFHIGHVGSTLVSRLLGELDGVLALREPRILRDLAMMPAGPRQATAPIIRQLVSRTFGADQVVLVKATSFVSEIAPLLVPPGERALLLYAAPRNYIASIFAGANSIKELERLTGVRAERMAARVAGLPPLTTLAQRAAAAWACEMTALEAAAAAMGDRQLAWADFDVLLADFGPGLAKLAEFFGFDASLERAKEIVRGPLMSRYSKALEYEYSPSLRRELIEQEVRLQGAAIDDALGMLDAAAEHSPLLANVLARC